MNVCFAAGSTPNRMPTAFISMDFDPQLMNDLDSRRVSHMLVVYAGCENVFGTC